MRDGDQQGDCARKHGHDKREKAIKHMLRFPARERRHLNVYRCNHCGKYHVGHQPGTIARRKSDKRNWN